MPTDGIRSTERNGASVDVVSRVAAVLGAFAVDRPARTLSEIARSAGLPASTVRRLLIQLGDVGLIDQDPDTHRYTLGLRFAQLGSIALEGIDLVPSARPVMHRLTDEVGEAVFLGKLTEHGVVYLAVTEPPVAIRVATHVGEIRPVHTTALGKVLLAGLSDTQREPFVHGPLPASTPHSITSGEALRAEVDEAGRQGYAVAFQESHLEFASVAAPVRDHTHTTVAALAVSAPVYRMPRERLHELAPSVIRAARELSASLGEALSDSA
ncbi:IclR family transcriptional regulator [Streptomyces sp. NPDC005962]|uniref:IclR family transcriptional regulator n=1 Tax=Streptomyces sp. NPDC005962 TaxID=3154466 RepID=UPI0033C74F39